MPWRDTESVLRLDDQQSDQLHPEQPEFKRDLMMFLEQDKTGKAHSH